MNMDTVSAAIRAHGSEAGATAAAKRLKYHLRAGPLYLFWNRSKLTNNVDHAWSGTVEQGRAARRKFDAAAGCKIRAIEHVNTAHKSETEA
jgi:hypothetical protein